MRHEKVLNLLTTVITIIFCIYQTIQTSIATSYINAIQWNMCIAEESVYAVFYDISIEECMSLCVKKDVCIAVSYHRLRKSCHFARSDDVLENVDVCKGHLYIKHEDMPVVTSTINSDSESICLLDKFDIYGDCESFGNIEKEGSKVRLKCPIAQFLCSDSVFQCGHDGNWTFRQCFEEMIVVTSTVTASVPEPGIVNVALNKPVSMSSMYSSTSPGSLLVDGDRDFRWPCACTQYSLDPSMVIDLGQVYTVSHMFMVNRGDCCSTRLHDVRISFGAALDNLQEYVYIPGQFGPHGIVQLHSPISTRYVKIQILGNEFLTICEFEIWNESS